MREIVAERTPHAKIFHIDGDRYHWRRQLGYMHYRDVDGKLRDVNLTARLDRGDHLIDQTFYTLRVKPSVPAYRYTSESGTVEAHLIAINDKPIGPRDAERDGGGFIWRGVTLDSDYVIVPKRAGVATELIVHSENAPRKWTWEILGDQALLSPIIGFDAARQRCEINVTQAGDRLTAEWTGRVTSRGRLRRKSDAPWTDNVVYPVRIDPTVNEAIVDTADDCSSIGGTFYSSYQNKVYAGHDAPSTVMNAGLRFQTVAIAQGATIDSAVITIEIEELLGSPVLTVYGDDVDDAAAFSAGNLPANITKTTANVDISPGSAGTFSIGVQGIVQEIISRGGWASNADIRFVLIDQVGTGDNSIEFADLNHATLAEAQFDVTFTVGGAAALAPGRGLLDSVLLAPRALVRC